MNNLMSDDEREFEEARQFLIDRIGPPQTANGPDPVDEDLVRQFRDQELDDETSAEVAYNISTFRDWHTAYFAALNRKHGLE